MPLQLQKLNGLSSVGPVAKHYHWKSPTPWAEEFVVALTGASEQTWVGNFQFGDSYYTDLIVWREAALFVIITRGACYLVSAENPDRYSCEQSTATGFLFNEDHSRIFVADHTDIYAYDSQSAIVWRRKDFAVDGIKIDECRGEFLIGSLCTDPDEAWSDFKIRESDGTNASD